MCPNSVSTRQPPGAMRGSGTMLVGDRLLNSPAISVSELPQRLVVGRMEPECDALAAGCQFECFPDPLRAESRDAG